MEHLPSRALVSRSNFPCPQKQVIHSLDKIIEWREKPGAIPVDSGVKYITERLVKLVGTPRVTVLQIQPRSHAGKHALPCNGIGVAESPYRARKPHRQARMAQAIHHREHRTGSRRRHTMIMGLEHSPPNISIGDIAPSRKQKMAA
jgi:hypothetical protein